MHIHFIIHEQHEAPGAFSQWAEDRGFYQTRTCLYLGEALPELINFDLLVILGGPQSPSTTVAECPYFNAEREIIFIRKCKELNKAIVGVCLGAQLIGEALGAKFESSPHKEIGYFPITLTDEGKSNEVFNHFKSTEVVGHWHNDMPGVLPTSKILAYSEGCPRQIIEYTSIIYGLQCHLEFTKHSVQNMIDLEFDLSIMRDSRWVQDPNEITEFNTVYMNDLLYKFLDALMLRYQKYSL